jgi:hypothetical protein
MVIKEPINTFKKCLIRMDDAGVENNQIIIPSIDDNPVKRIDSVKAVEPVKPVEVIKEIKAVEEIKENILAIPEVPEEVVPDDENDNEEDKYVEPAVAVAVKKYNPNLEEVNLEHILEDNNIERIKLKKPNEVYYDIYRSAREKAKNMRKLAIQAYLEAKEIKTKYILEDIDISDEDEENEYKL